MSETTRTILPRYVHIRTFGGESASYLSSSPSTEHPSPILTTSITKKVDQSQLPPPSTLFEAIPVEDFDSSLPEILERRAQAARAKAKHAPSVPVKEKGKGDDNKAGEKDHSTTSSFENMYYFRNVLSGGVIALDDAGASSQLGLEKDEGKASVLVLMRIDRNIFRIGVTGKEGLLYLSSLGAEKGAAISLSETVLPDTSTKFLFEGGMSLRITDIRYHTGSAKIRVLSPLICSIPLSPSKIAKQSGSENKNGKLRLNLPRAKGIWRNGLGYGVGPQAIFDTGLPYVVWTGVDSSSKPRSAGSRPSVEVGKVVKNVGRNAIFGEKDDMAVVNGVSLRKIMLNSFDGSGLELRSLLRESDSEVEHVEVNLKESTDHNRSAQVTIPRYIIECKWTCRAHVIWHDPANANGEISVDETGVYEGISFGDAEVVLKSNDYSVL